jgi:hypothetical protein
MPLGLPDVLQILLSLDEYLNFGQMLFGAASEETYPSNYYRVDHAFFYFKVITLHAHPRCLLLDDLIQTIAYLPVVRHLFQRTFFDDAASRPACQLHRDNSAISRRFPEVETLRLSRRSNEWVQSFPHCNNDTRFDRRCRTVPAVFARDKNAVCFHSSARDLGEFTNAE